jgi:hypothetical protein
MGQDPGISDSVHVPMAADSFSIANVFSNADLIDHQELAACSFQESAID